MKKLLALFILLPSVSLADGLCKIPKDCEVISSEFSTGGGNKVSYLMEVDCKTKDGFVKYVDWQISAGSLFGIGRFTAPDKIVFKKANVKKLECKY